MPSLTDIDCVALLSACLIDMPGDIDQGLDGQIVISNCIANASPFPGGGRVDFAGLQQTEAGAGGIAVSTTGSLQAFISGN